MTDSLRREGVVVNEDFQFPAPMSLTLFPALKIERPPFIEECPGG